MSGLIISMKYYPPVLVLLRFVAVAVFLFFLYRLSDTWLTVLPDGFGKGDGMTNFLEFERDQRMMKSFLTMVTGAILYGLAPLLARTIVAGADRNESESP